MRLSDSIFENLPEFSRYLRGDLPPQVMAKWLKKYVKKDISLEEFSEFIKYRSYYGYFEDYKESLDYFILKDTLCMKLDEWDWFHKKFTVPDDIKFIRYFKLWTLQRS